MILAMNRRGQAGEVTHKGGLKARFGSDLERRDEARCPGLEKL